MQLMSERAYAEHRRTRGLMGGTQAAVNKAVASGRITKVVDPESKKLMIDPAIADAQWERNTDLDQALRTLGSAAPGAITDEASPAAPKSAVQTSAPPNSNYEAEALRFHPGLELGLVALPTILTREGLGRELVDRVLDSVCAAIRRELRARGEPVRFIAREIEAMLELVAEERANPGSWTE